MAASEYYQPSSNRPTGSGPSPSPYYSPYGQPDDRHSPAPPSYASEAPYPTHDRPAQVSSHGGPFESVFDDHVYPLKDPKNPQRPAGAFAGGAGASGAGSGGYISEGSQQSFAQDTRYYGSPPSDAHHPGGRRHENTFPANGNSTDDIPLENRPPKPDEMHENDHVYDAEAPGRKKSRRRKVRFGQLGMLGASKKRIPWVVYIFTIIQAAVFIGEIIRNAQETGSPIMIKPQFNPMIGPSQYVLINMGSRFVLCMHEVDGVPKDTTWPCPSSTSLDPNDPNNKCTIGELCGFGAPKTADSPNQWFRFILPIFLHAGLVHIGFNMLLQLTLGREMEMSIGSLRFFIVYLSAGIFGFVMGGNYAATGVSSTGASGSLFGVIALTLLDLLYSWNDRKSPVKDLMFIILDMVISFVLGLLPGLDNFSHIGGFLMGLCLGVCVLHSPNSLRRRIGQDSDATYASVETAREGEPKFVKNPVGFFKGRKPLWWVWWLIRAGALLTVIIVFILLLQNFYVYHNKCDWCKYLSCLPINGWCDLGNLQFNQTPGTPTQTSAARRGLF